MDQTALSQAIMTERFSQLGLAMDNPQQISPNPIQEWKGTTEGPEQPRIIPPEVPSANAVQVVAPAAPSAPESKAGEIAIYRHLRTINLVIVPLEQPDGEFAPGLEQLGHDGAETPEERDRLFTLEDPHVGRTVRPGRPARPVAHPRVWRPPPRPQSARSPAFL